jgi:hypothetical protein
MAFIYQHTECDAEAEAEEGRDDEAPTASEPPGIAIDAASAQRPLVMLPYLSLRKQQIADRQTPIGDPVSTRRSNQGDTLGAPQYVCTYKTHSMFVQA